MTDLEGKTANTVSILKTIHRGPEGYVAFCDKASGPFRNIAAVEVRELSNILPPIMSDFIKDLYFSVNTQGIASPFETKLSEYRWRNPMRKEKYLSYLNACYVDHDVGRNPGEAKTKAQTLPVGFTIGAIIELQERGLIPPPSMMARSGQGLYSIWLLQAADDDFTPPKAFPEKIVLYKLINKALQGRLSGLAPDENAFDAARVLRVPNSIHSKTGNRVHYWAQFDENQQMPFYTMRELARFLNIPLAHDERIIEQKKFYGKKTIDAGSQPKRRNGQDTLNKKRLEDYHAIEQIHMAERGHTWTQGKRRRALSYMAHFMKRCGHSQSDTISALKRSAQNCEPPYPSDPSDTPIEAIVSDLNHAMVLSDRELKRVFDINDEFIKTHIDDLTTIGVPKEEKKKRIAIRKEDKALRHDEKFKAIFGLMKRSPKMVSYRDMEKRLKRKGVDMSHETARKITGIIKSSPELMSELRAAWNMKPGK